MDGLLLSLRAKDNDNKRSEVGARAVCPLISLWPIERGGLGIVLSHISSATADEMWGTRALS
jgi:hypothetical protein